MRKAGGVTFNLRWADDAVHLVVNVESRGIFRVSSAKSHLPDSSDAFLFGMNIIL